MNNLGKSVLIIRTEPGATNTASKVTSLGFNPIVLPAARAVPTNAKFDHRNVQAILVTSSNAPRLTKFCPEAFAIPVYAVGDATAAAAREIGFEDVISAGGDASALAVLVADRLKKENGALLHLRGTEVAGDVTGFLNSCGFETRAQIVYETVDCPEFKEKLSNILEQNSGYVLFHSPKGSKRFIEAANNKLLANWCALGISQAAIAPIAQEKLEWAGAVIAAAPNEESMLELLT